MGRTELTIEAWAQTRCQHEDASAWLAGRLCETTAIRACVRCGRRVCGRPHAR
jgi:hypothetical protein